MKNTSKLLFCLLVIGALLIPAVLAEVVIIDDVDLGQDAIQIDAGDEGLVLEDASGDALELDEALSIDLDLTGTEEAVAAVEPVGNVAEPAIAANDTPVSNFEFKDGLVKKYLDTSDSAAYIPATYQDPNDSSKSITVIGIDTEAFMDCFALETVTFPDTMRTIGKGAFKGCANLKSVTLPANLKIIDDEAFKGCTKLASVTVNKLLYHIGASAFEGCAKLTAIALPDRFEFLGKAAFSGCSALASATLGGDLQAIPDELFKNCTSLTAITVPSGVSSIGASAFADCHALSSVTLNSSLGSIGEYAFLRCISLNSIELPASVKALAASVFCGSGLIDYVVPDSITSIGDYAFMDCPKLNSVVVSNSVTSIGIDAFKNCTKLTSFTFGNGIKTIPRLFDFDCEKLTTIVIPSGVTGIADDAFKGMRGLRNVQLPDTLKTIGARAFEDCVYLSAIDLPNAVYEIGKEAFSGCRLLDNLTLPANLARINESTFENCYTLSAITVPDGVTRIEEKAFYQCHSLGTVTLPTSLSYIGTEAFAINFKMTQINIPNSVTEIGSKAFFDCTALTSVTLSRGLRVFGNASTDNPYSDDSIFSKRDNFVCYVYEGSEALNYCKFQGITYEVIEKPAPTPAIDIAGSKVESIADQVYTGRSLKPEVKVSYGDATLVEGTDYTVEYTDNRKVGKATVTVTGIGSYTGVKTVTFKIFPKATTITKLKKGARQFTVKWAKRINQVSGYQLQYSTSAEFTTSRKKTVSDGKATSTVITGLKKNTTYYVRIRTFHTVSGKKYYSAWSSASSVTTE